MKRHTIIHVLATAFLTLTATAGEDRLVKLAVSEYPYAILSSPHADALRVYSPTDSETSDSELSVAGSVMVGAVFDTPYLDVELKFGTGALVNPSFYGGFYRFDLALFGEAGPFRFGPHMGVLTFDSVHWTGDADLDLDNNAGWLGGLLLEYRKESWSWMVSVDYFDCELDLKPGPGWMVNHNQLELSGTMIQIGFKKRF